MVKIKKEDIEIKTNSDLIRDFHESRFHHQDYISLAIEVLFERGLTRTILFEKKATQDLVNAICFDSDKHKNQYLQLVKEELEDRNYDVSSIPDIENKENYNARINGENSKSFSFPKFGKWTRVGISIAIIVFIKMGIRYSAEKSREQDEKLEVLLYGNDGLLKSSIDSYKHELDSLKSVSQSFVLSTENKKEIIKSAMLLVEEAFSKSDWNEFEKTKNYKSDFLKVYHSELQELLDSY
jgi:hypothetical protein